MIGEKGGSSSGGGGGGGGGGGYYGGVARAVALDVIHEATYAMMRSFCLYAIEAA